MILLFDLDQTLIDTERLKKNKSDIFGISEKEDSLHNDLLFKNQGRNYNPDVHLQFLLESGRIKTIAEKNKIKAKHQKLIKNIDKYVFPEAEKTLALLKKQGHRLILMTLGDKSFQKSKVDNSRIKKYFEKIIYETKNKSQNKFIKQLAKSNNQVLIINDRADQSLAMKKVIGKKAEIYLVRGPKSNNIQHKEKIHRSIGELKNIL